MKKMLIFNINLIEVVECRVVKYNCQRRAKYLFTVLFRLKIDCFY